MQTPAKKPTRKEAREAQQAAEAAAIIKAASKRRRRFSFYIEGQRETRRAYFTSYKAAAAHAQTLADEHKAKTLAGWQGWAHTAQPNPAD